MAKIRVSKEFNFEMAHALKNYDGPCKNIHGHSYKLFVTVIGEPIIDESNTKLGMLIDFGDLKKIVNKEIVDVFDHAFVLYKNSNFNCNEPGHEMFGKTIFVEYQPTCENLVMDFAEKLKSKFSVSVKLHNVRLYETATSFAEWFASDNV